MRITLDVVPTGRTTATVILEQEQEQVDAGDLEDALASAGLREAWDRQSNTNRKEFVRGVVEAKKPETSASRIEKVVTTLSQ